VVDVLRALLLLDVDAECGCVNELVKRVGDTTALHLLFTAEYGCAFDLAKFVWPMAGR
jgi:hypothetical protein